MYKLIHLKTKEETICSLVTIDGFNYYVSECSLKEKDWVINNNFLNQISSFRMNNSDDWKTDGWRKVIASNKQHNPNIAIPKVIDNSDIYDYSESLSKSLYDEERHRDDLIKSLFAVACQSGYEKAKETYQFTEKDVLNFTEYYKNNAWLMKNTNKEILDIWKEQRINTLYYE